MHEATGSLGWHKNQASAAIGFADVQCHNEQFSGLYNIPLHTTAACLVKSSARDIVSMETPTGLTCLYSR